MQTTIDVHHHMIPEPLAAALRAQQITTIGGEPLPAWSVDDSLMIMDRFGIGHAVLSVPIPLHFLPPQQAAELARQLNAAGQQYRARSAGRFGYFAALPLPDVDSSVSIACQALDEQQAAGVGMLTNHHGIYPGDPAWDSLYAALDDRGAVVFVHPTVLTGRDYPRAPYDGSPLPGVQPSQLEFGFDTTRAVANILLHRIPERFPRLRFIFTHSGACVPSVINKLIDRRPLVQSYTEHLRDHGTPPPVDLLLTELADAEAAAHRRVARLYFDVALSTSADSLRSLHSLVPTSQLLLGTDFPFGKEIGLRYTLRGLQDFGPYDGSDRDAIDHGNAAALGLGRSVADAATAATLAGRSAAG